MRIGSNVYLRTDGRWEARYQKDKDENGKTRYGYVYGKTQEEAEKKRSDKLKEIHKDLELDSILASQNPKVSAIPVQAAAQAKRSRRERFQNPFSQKEAELIRDQLITDDLDSSTAFLFCLLTGLSVGEAAALRYGDISWKNKTVVIRQMAVNSNRRLTITACPERTVPLTDYILSILVSRGILYRNPEYYVCTGSANHPETTMQIESTFRRTLKNVLDVSGISSASLRSTFIRMCLEANLNIETVSALTGSDSNSIYQYFGRFIQPNPADISRVGICCGAEKCRKREKHLNLLILGAGSHGHGVKEIAKMLGVFHKIRFLDDRVEADEVIGKCADYLQFAEEYPAAFPAFGDNELREKWTEALQNAGFALPLLIHPSAIVSDHVRIADGTVIMSQVTINSGVEIGKSCIIAPNSMIGFGSKIGCCAHLDSGCIIPKNTAIPPRTLVDSGEVYRNAV